MKSLVVKHRLVSVVLAGLALSATLSAQTPSEPATTPAELKREAALKPGEAAPQLKVAEWVKGTPITRFEPGKVYLVEFWATWCGPCIGNIPHLNALQKKYGKDGLIIIGMTNPDLDADYTGARKENNTLQQVRDFVTKQGDKMDYPVAYDTAMRETYKSMMGTLPGIPHAFLIGRDGKLVVDYHPFFLDDAVAKVLAGTWNHERDLPELQRSSKLYSQLTRPKDYESFKASFATMEKDFPRLAHRTLSTKFKQALKAGDHPAALAAGRAMIARANESGDTQDIASSARATARELAALQRSVVAGLADEKRFAEARALVAEMAACALAVSKSAESAAHAAVAELAYGNADLAAAVKAQKEAVATATAAYLPGEQKRLEEFESALADQTRRDRAG